MNYFILAGEASGDLHGSNLAKAIYSLDEQATINGWGGEQMKNVGVNVSKDYKDLAIMGFVEIITRLPEIFKNLKTATKKIMTQQTDAVILIDFSGFNLRLAKKLRKAGYQGKIFYYISPKLWVWNAKRVNVFKKYIDAVYCILPFEVDFYDSKGYSNAHYIGNPLMDAIEPYEPNQNFRVENQLSDKEIIALLPGSRSNEIKHILPELLKVVHAYPEYQFVIAGVKAVEPLIRQELKKASIELPILFNQTYDLVHHARLALVTSGTATLETALLGTPLILCYKGNKISYAIAKQVTNIDYIGLPNLIMNKPMVKELIQENLTKETLHQQMKALLTDKETIQQFQRDQEKLAQKVGKAGASQRAAELMVNALKS